MATIGFFLVNAMFKLGKHEKQNTLRNIQNNLIVLLVSLFGISK